MRLLHVIIMVLLPPSWMLATDLDAVNPHKVKTLEARLVSVINQAASKTIPKTRLSSRGYRDAWYYNDKIKESAERQRTPENLTLLREAARDAKELPRELGIITGML